MAKKEERMKKNEDLSANRSEFSLRPAFLVGAKGELCEKLNQTLQLQGHCLSRFSLSLSL